MKENQFQHKLLSPVSAATVLTSFCPFLISYQVKLYDFYLHRYTGKEAETS